MVSQLQGGIILVSMLALAWILPHAVERRGRQWMEQRLSLTAGNPVHIAQLRLSLWPPGIALEQLRVGSWLAADQVLLRANGSNGLVPSLNHVTLIRPRFVVQSTDRSVSSARRAGRSIKQLLLGLSKRHGLSSRHWQFEVQDGSIQGTYRLHGYELRLHLAHVYVQRRSQWGYRLILGASRLQCRGWIRARFASASLEFDRSTGVPTRFAALDGQVYLDRAAGTRLGVQALRGSYSGSGSGTLLARLTETSGSRGSATLSVSAAQWGKEISATLHLDALPLRPLSSVFAPLGIDASEMLADGELRLRRRMGVMWKVEATTGVRSIWLDHPLLSQKLVGPFDSRFKANLQFDTRHSTLTLQQLHVELGALSMDLNGHAIVGPERRYLSAELKIPPLPCQSALTSLPGGFAPQLRGFAMQGNVGLRGRVELDGRDLDQGVVEIAFAPLTCRVLADPPAADAHALKRTMSRPMYGEEGQLHPWTLGPYNPCYRRLSQISPVLSGAFIAAEDSRFLSHRGFDTAQLRRAFLFDLQVGKAARGASTISQQLVKNMFLSPHRTIARKFQEAVLTWRIEQVLSKRDILQAYLNRVELGPGIYGVEQAAQRYFGRSAAEVTPLQAAHLAALTPSPRPLARRFAQAPPGESWMDRLRLILGLMRQGGAIDAATERRWGHADLGLLPLRFDAAQGCAQYYSISGKRRKRGPISER